MQRLDPRVVGLWRLQALIRLVTFWIPVTVVGAFFAGSQVGLAVSVAIAAGLIALQLVLAMLWPALRFHTFGFELRPADLTVHSGVLYRNAVSVPLRRVQFVDVRQSPLERARGLATLMVYTAAGPVVSGVIAGVDFEEAGRLRDRLVHRGGDQGV